MRSSPSGRKIPNEILRYTMPIITANAGTNVSPLPFAQSEVVLTSGSDANRAIFLALPGALDLGTVTVLSGGGNTGSPLSCQWLLVTVSPAGLPIITPAGDPFTIDPTAPTGVSYFQIDASDVIVPDTGAALVLQVTVPMNVVINTFMDVFIGVGLVWKEAAIRNQLI